MKALVWAFVVIVKTGCGTDRAVHRTNLDTDITTNTVQYTSTARTPRMRVGDTCDLAQLYCPEAVVNVPNFSFETHLKFSNGIRNMSL